MRLGQLARKLSIRPADVVSFLANHQVNVDAGTNTRLNDEHVLLVVRAFAPALESTILQDVASDAEIEPVPIESSDADALMVVASAEVDTMHEHTPSPEPASHTVEDSMEGTTQEVAGLEQPSDPFEGIDVIRAPKVELPGLKVLGKIDLPEPRKKETPAEGEAGSKAEARHRRDERNRKEERPRRNSIALQREREAREAARKREEEKNQKKAQRKQNYIRKVQVKPAAQKTEKVKVVRPERAASKSKQPATSWWGRFTGWLFRQ